ncbi:DUF692 domain-containing protein [Amycolatopsis cynarae]|uniref:DUF692 domain-containing protein n=1 Tax=Amycolatopsis cynarae TaxID=2995223 RepID=A0ABY7BC02_9PSEU|nr:DUF692 domain-containing protein [Amycolatopsis sp. HUAS 11-8]WAL69464.1 DUF692 domain-containing protein [Amycolatopsis sp. HUAS 11-8]
MAVAAESRELGVGLGWRPELDVTVERLRPDFVEVVAENLHPAHLPEPLRQMAGRVPVLPHAVSLSLGGAEPVAPHRVGHLAALAEVLGAPLVSDHVCFVRAGDLDSGHLMPLPRTRDALDVLVANVRAVQQDLPVPLALENIAALLTWPDAELTEAQFLRELTEQTGCLLLVDVANLYANARNLGGDPVRLLDELPLDRLAYAHVAGGVERHGVYHDTHTHPVPAPVLDLLRELAARAHPPGVLLEWDDDYPGDSVFAAELAAIRDAAGKS